MADIITQQKLSNLDRDIADAGKALNTKAVITPRYGASFESLPLAIQKVIETGGFEPFATEAQLKASTPTLIKKASYALDTHKIWLWENGSWKITGLSALELSRKEINDLGLRKTTKKAFVILDAVNKEAFSVTNEGDVQVGDLRARQEKMQFACVLARDSKGIVSLAISKTGDVIAGNVLVKSTKNFQICDANGKTAIHVSSKGDVVLGKSSIVSHNMYPFVIRDSAGKASLIVDKTGKLNDFTKAQSIKYSDWHKADVMFVASLGQSLSKGRNSLPIKNTTQPYANITFLSGELKNGSSGDYSGFKPLIGEVLDANYGESPNIWHLNKLVEKQVNKGESAEKWVFLGTAPQSGGTPMQGLNKGSPSYKYYIDQVQAAFNLCQNQGNSFVVSHNTWTQGEDDYSLKTTKDAYKFEQILLKNNIAEDVIAITKQKFRPVLITYQCPAHRNYGGNKNYNAVAQAQFEAALEDPEIILACPIYHLSFHTDNVHLTSDGSQQLGYYYANVSEKVIVNCQKWQPLQPKSLNWQGRVIDLVFNVPEGHLEFDTALVAVAANMGFDIWQGDTLLDIISSVMITDTNRIKIILNADAPSDAVISYARGRESEGAVTSSANRPRGNLRDTAGNTDFYTNTSGTTTYMHNWCVMFNINANFGA